MPSINLETLKQLLEEFSEKEALTTEEINVIEKEISNLEQRIVFCRNKLQSLSADREKLTAMQERYIEGNFKQYLQNSIPSSGNDIDALTSTSSTPTIFDAPNNQSSSLATAENSQAKAASHISDASQVLPESIATVPTAQNQHLPPPVSSAINDSEINEPSEDSQDGANKESGEPKKKINDALKGLFRK